ncbi:MAG: putative spermidine/putrescine transport system permease protein, partial [Chloroflexota bacterium]|nr:putative spermidine/putrescine transport system permease protein [Chloroflexota bacterium]
MKLTRIWWWIVFILGFLYFFLPLLGTFEFSLGHPIGPVHAPPTLDYYTGTLGTSQFWDSLGYSFIVGFITIIVSIGLILPTAFWVRLRVPRARPFIEFVTLL